MLYSNYHETAAVMKMRYPPPNEAPNELTAAAQAARRAARRATQRVESETSQAPLVPIRSTFSRIRALLNRLGTAGT